MTLEILQRRSDGWHALRSVMVPIELCDELTIGRGGHDLRFTCDDRALESSNIVERAFDALAPADRGYAIHLRKRIPSGAGLGGGSSDAAALLLAAQTGAFGAGETRDYLQIARELGSDVPFFLVQTGALVEGTGERVTAAGALPPWHAVVVAPPYAVSTATAYAAIDASERTTRPRNASASLAALAALQRGDFGAVAALLQNDFEPVITTQVPAIATALGALREAGAEHPILTGSGSCVFALTRNVTEAEHLRERIALPEAYTIRRVAFATGAAWRSA
ncbi:MAG: 4-(cytidine 5'-diphospho)-2-C-methyl-D-erythritol kinase, partial [Rhodanobacteraceae bacterium]